VLSSAHLNKSRQVYIVTGARTGVGYGIVVHLLQHNASKIVILNNSEAHMQALADLKQYGDTSRVIWATVQPPESARDRSGCQETEIGTVSD
jgi:NAD(P)-dependent dehydrogenase (short-subunit alcohol dehydrogenase family)